MPLTDTFFSKGQRCEKFKRSHRLSSIFVGILLFSTFTHAEPLKVTVSVDKTSLALNQQLTLTVDLSGDGANKVGSPNLPDISEFLSFLGSGGTSQSINFINGRMTVHKSYTYYYMATKEGTFEIKPVTVAYDGKTYQSKPIQISIIQSAPQSQQPRTRRTPEPSENTDNVKGQLFVRALVSKRRVYQNEPLVLTFRIYTNVNVTNYGISKMPGTSGFWVENIPMSTQTQVRQEVVNGIKYTTADVKKMVLFPTSPGKKTIDPLGIECDIRVQNRRRRDFFDSFFDDPFFGRSVRKSIYSKPINIEVLPLPETNKPQNFSGAVGSFNLSTTIDKTSAKTNEAISLKVKISGQGNIKILPEPEIEIPSDFEEYEPKITENIDRSGNTVNGSKTFEYVLVPRFAGTQRISPIEFAYFDIGKRDYKVLRSNEIIVNVAKGDDEFTTPGVRIGKEEVRYIGQDIRFIKKGVPSFSKAGANVFGSTLYMVLLIFPAIALVGSLGYRRHQEKLGENIAYARSRKATTVAMSRLRRAKGLLSESSQKDFYAEVARALQGYVGDKLNIAEAGLITEQVEYKLKTEGAEVETVQKLVDCLQHCDYQRFAPSNATDGEMKAFFEKAKQVIVSLEKSL